MTKLLNYLKLLAVCATLFSDMHVEELELRINELRSQNITPVVFSDIDGTTADARQMTVSYLTAFLSLYNGEAEISKEELQRSFIGATNINWWDATTFLESLGLDRKIYPVLHKQAYAYFSQNFFFTPANRINAPIIPSVVSTLQLLQQKGAEVVLVTLRHPMEDGSSLASVKFALKYGFSGKVVYSPYPINWQRVRDKLEHEPSKADLISSYLNGSPDIGIAYFDNDPAHNNAVFSVFPDMLNVNVYGDVPHASIGTELSEGIVVFKP
jgi:hypothetical protein